MATITETDRLSVEVSGYEIERRDWDNGEQVWKLCYTTPGYSVPESKSYPCRYRADELEDARKRLAKFRENHPEIKYRMTRMVTITEVVE